MRGGAGKVGVIGAVSRKGNVVCKVIGNADEKTLTNFARKTVSDKVDLVATNEWLGYKNLGKQYPHQVVAHSKGEYVRGTVHTNTLDNFWSLLKRGRDRQLPSGEQEVPAVVPRRVLVPAQQQGKP